MVAKRIKFGREPFLSLVVNFQRFLVQATIFKYRLIPLGALVCADTRETLRTVILWISESLNDTPNTLRGFASAFNAVREIPVFHRTGGKRRGRNNHLPLRKAVGSASISACYKRTILFGRVICITSALI